MPSRRNGNNPNGTEGMLLGPAKFGSNPSGDCHLYFLRCDVRCPPSLPRIEEQGRICGGKSKASHLQEMQNHTTSIAAFSRACQYVDFNPLEMNRESAILLLMTFRVQQLLSPGAAKEQLSQLRAQTRKQVEDTAREYATLIVSSGIGKMKEGYSL